MNDKITTHTRLAVLKHLVKGKSPDVVAAAERLSRFEVIDIASSHGYPDPTKMARAVEIITNRLAEDERDALTVAHAPRASTPATSPSVTQPRPAPPRRAVPAPEAAGVSTQPPAVPEDTDELSLAVDAGKKSSSKRIKALAGRIETDVARLTGLLEEEQTRLETARKAVEAKAELKRKKEQLERELATVKAQLRGGTTKKAAPDRSMDNEEPSAKQIRAWARASGVDCPASGRVPQKVREAYDDAHASAAA